MAPNESVSLRLGLSTGMSPETNLQYYRPLTAFLEKKMGIPVEIAQRTTYSEINDLLSFNQIDLALVCSSSYCLGRNMEILAVPQKSGATTYQSFIIVPADLDLNNFDQLRGKVFAFTDPLSTTGTIYPLARIAALGEKPSSFFKTYFYTYSHEKSIEAVAEKVVDGAAVDSSIWVSLSKLNPSLVKKIKIIERSPEYPNSPLVIRKDLNPAVKEEIRKLFLKMDKDPEGKRILAKFDIDKFILLKDEDYIQVKQMLQQVVGK